MKRFIQGEIRAQSTLLPERLEDYISEANPVRVVDAFVEHLDLGPLGFDGVVPATTGRPSYRPATSGCGTGLVGHIVQTAVDSKHHLIVAHDVTHVGEDRSAFSNMAKQAGDAMGVPALTVVADRGHRLGIISSRESR